MTQHHTLNVVIPATDARTSRELIAIGETILGSSGGTGVVLSVVEVPEDRSLSEGALVVRRRRNLLRRMADIQPHQDFRPEVRTARSTEEGLRAAATESDAGLLLLGWHPGGNTGDREMFKNLIDDPPCDLAFVRRGRNESIGKVLLPVRGGPHAQLALRLAEALAQEHEATLTLLHIDTPRRSPRQRALEHQYFDDVRRQVKYPNTRQLEIETDAVEAALLEQAAEHDLVVMGASAPEPHSRYLLGRLPGQLARQIDGSLIVVKTREPIAAAFASEPPAEAAFEREVLSANVDRWFAENTFHSHEFRSLRYLLELKERQGKTISLALPTLNEEETVGKIISTIKRQLVDNYPLLDEIIVVDSKSEDRTVEICEDLGIPVFQHPDILPQYGSYRGKGEGLWKSLYVTKGDIVVWIDSDIRGIHPKFVYGLIGPLLTQPHLGFVKGFYRRPLNLDGQSLTTGGGRVTELTARPLINLFYPELSGLVQPLAGEMAGRRDVLEAVPFFTGYGVETGLLIDILQQFGIRSIAQTDLEERVHRNQSLFSLSKMAFAIVQVVVNRLAQHERLELSDQMATSMKLIHYAPTELYLEVKEIEEHERPPINSIEEYRRRAEPAVPLVGAGAASSASN